MERSARRTGSSKGGLRLPRRSCTTPSTPPTT